MSVLPVALASLIETCKLNQVDPEAYVADVVTRIQDHPNSRLDELLPWAYRASPESGLRTPLTLE